MPTEEAQNTAELVAEEAVRFTSELIRIDTTNTGDPATLVAERPAAEYVAEHLDEVGYEVCYVEPGAAGRASVVVRLAGADPTRGALLVHGHLDVVPADASEWSLHPLSGEVADGCVWGRGAVDMKGTVGTVLAVARQLRRTATVPPRDLVFAFLADEECGGTLGARWLIEHRRGLFEGVTEAVGEVGGFSVTLPGASGDPVRAYLVATAEKGVGWLRLRARGVAGHGSMLAEDNAVAKLAAAVTRLDTHRFPIVLTPPVREFLAAVTEITGVVFSEDDPEAVFARLGNLARMVGATLRDTAQVTMLAAGYKANVVPSLAEATVDCRVLPGREAAFAAEVAELLGPGIEWSWDAMAPVATTFDGALVDAMTGALVAEDPDARVLPYMLSASTDAKSFQELGIRTFGFAPMRLPPELDYAALFHGVDERVPVDALGFGARVLTRLLETC